MSKNQSVTGKRRFGALIIGDEILSGKRQDAHFARMRTLFSARGLRLSWVHYAVDERATLINLFERSFADQDIVFSFGGIGNTPDDHTRQAVSAALKLPLILSAEAERILLERFGESMTPEQKLLATFPKGSRLVPNPVNRIPGFMLREHHCLPGFPEMAHPMVEWVLDNCYAELHVTPGSNVEKALLLSGPDAYESLLLDLMQSIVDAYPDLRLFSLPGISTPGSRHLELGVEGPPQRVDEALTEMIAAIESLDQINWRWR